jgi:hypothetical protein
VDYGVSRVTITNIVNGRTWRHILAEELDRPTDDEPYAVAA